LDRARLIALNFQQQRYEAISVSPGARAPKSEQIALLAGESPSATACSFASPTWSANWMAIMSRGKKSSLLLHAGYGQSLRSCFLTSWLARPISPALSSSAG